MLQSRQHDGRKSCPHDTRTETDSFGPIEVPADAYWGAQTERSIENFPFGPREQMPLEIVHALGFIKQAAARVNARIGGLDPKLAEVIQQAAARSRARRPRQPVPAGHLADRVGHPVEHERQ